VWVLGCVLARPVYGILNPASHIPGASRHVQVLHPRERVQLGHQPADTRTGGGERWGFRSSGGSHYSSNNYLVGP